MIGPGHPKPLVHFPTRLALIYAALAGQNIHCCPFGIQVEWKVGPRLVFGEHTIPDHTYCWLQEHESYKSTKRWSKVELHNGIRSEFDKGTYYNSVMLLEASIVCFFTLHAHVNIFRVFNAANGF